MSSRKKTPAWVQILAIAAGVITLVGGLYAFVEWQKNAPTMPVAQMRVEVSNGATTRDLAPYTICELDEQCDGGQPETLLLDASADVTFAVPKDLAASSWKLLAIYDDPAANNEQLFQSGESTTASIPAVKDGARLVVAEVSQLAIDTHGDGEEIPVVATWSVAFE